MKQRIQTAILALIVFIPFVIYGGWPFTLFVYFLATIALVELIRMRKGASNIIPLLLGIGLVWIVLLQITGDIIPCVWFTKIEGVVLFVMLLLAYTVQIGRAHV